MAKRNQELTASKKIETFEQACEALGLNPAEETPFPLPTSERQEGINAASKLTIIAEALNDGWVPNWDNYNEAKYYPWFYMRSEAASGSGFSFIGCYYDGSDSDVGARLVFKSRELAEYAGKQFTELYKSWMLISK